MRRIGVLFALAATGLVGWLVPAALPAADASCPTSGLVVWLDTNGNGAAGSTYFQLKFTNLSGHACTLLGYPGVSAVGLSGAQIGSAGRRDPSLVKVVHLAKGATAQTTLRIVDALNFPSAACHVTSAAGIRVYPPNQTASKIVPFPFQACARTGPVILSVQAVK